MLRGLKIMTVVFGAILCIEGILIGFDALFVGLFLGFYPRQPTKTARR